MTNRGVTTPFPNPHQLNMRRVCRFGGGDLCLRAT